MRDNTPPRMPEIEDDLVEEVEFENDDAPPEEDFDDEYGGEMHEVELEDLERYLQRTDQRDDSSDDDENADSAPVPDEAVLTFRRHTAPVFSCHMHPNLNIAVTGGEDDKAYIWCTIDGEVIETHDEHRDTVTEVHFSHDGHYLATADMAGEVYVYKLQEADAPDGASSSAACSPKFQQVWQYSMGDMSWMRWHYASHVLMAGSEAGEVYVWRIPSGDCKILPSTGARCEVAQLSHDGKKLFCAYADHKVKLWDLKNCQALFEVDENHPMGHKSDILAVACDKDAPIYISGDTDGKIVMSTNNGPVNALKMEDPIECLSFSPSTELKLFASGCISGKVIIWDYTKNSVRCICENTTSTDDGITRLEWISEYTLLVGTMKGRILAFDGRTGIEIFTLSGHNAHIYDFCYKPSEKNSAQRFRGYDRKAVSGAESIRLKLGNVHCIRCGLFFIFYTLRSYTRYLLSGFLFRFSISTSSTL